jgi:D-beta-D-heptose 7-phosphate kinase/D-beta-D-heptose 1-phosphate adenosyltransferase
MQDKSLFLSSLRGKKILVAGDLMLDKFIYGDVSRISPEGPIPVLKIESEKSMLGGAGNVITNLHALGALPVPFAVTGDDVEAGMVHKILQDLGMPDDGIIPDSSRPTTIKTRFVCKNQQLLRTDVEKTHMLDSVLESAMKKRIEASLKDVRAVVLSDYGKGFFTKSMAQFIIQEAGKRNIPVLVDPKGDDYSAYQGADIVTPNRKELGEAAHVNVPKSDQDIVAAATKIIQSHGIKVIVATRSEDGLSLVRGDKEPVHIKAKAHAVFDVSGAGDTVIATLAACIAAGLMIEDAAVIANIAGGIAVSKPGTAPVSFEELDQALSAGGFNSASGKIVYSHKAAQEKVAAWKAMGLKVGLTNGCFDILHAGHVNYINEARGHCDKLIVALNQDASVKILKGPSRPVNNQNARAVVLSGLGAVDMVTFFGAQSAGEDNTPCTLIEQVKPDIYFKGGDYKIEQLPEAKIVHAYGGEVLIMAMHEGFSTTAIIERSRKSGQG